MRFTKMHGLGNDYVYINGFKEVVDDPAMLAPAISDRHFGVGSDGLILVLPPDDERQADVRMRMFNADGSEAEMCGNGVRCVCKFAHDHGLSHRQPMRVQTGRGVLTLRYTLDPHHKVDEVTVEMGTPILQAAQIPVNLPGVAQVVNEPLEGRIAWPVDVAPADWTARCALEPRMTCVSMGNPHVVLFCDDVAAVPLEQVGPVLERHPLFPRRINVHFVQVQGRDEVTMRTWERGSGITLACGTGACAVAVAGVLTGRTNRAVQAHLPGGDLHLLWREDEQVEMTGPATEVFNGEWAGQAMRSGEANRVGNVSDRSVAH